MTYQILIQKLDIIHVGQVALWVYKIFDIEGAQKFMVEKFLPVLALRVRVFPKNAFFKVFFAKS